MSIGAEELILYVDNDKKLSSHKKSVFRNAALAKAKKTFDHNKALAVLKRFAREGAKGYTKQIRREDPKKWHKHFTPSDIELAAKQWLDHFLSEYRHGVYECLLPPKYQKAATHKKTAKALALAETQRNHSIGKRKSKAAKSKAAKSKGAGVAKAPKSKGTKGARGW